MEVVPLGRRRSWPSAVRRLCRANGDTDIVDVHLLRRPLVENADRGSLPVEDAGNGDGELHLSELPPDEVAVRDQGADDDDV